MNEFIVFSISGNRFLEINEFAVNMHGKIIILKEGKIFDVVEGGQEYILCRGIGRADIDGNKIYADSSIVEFKWKDSTSAIHYSKGVFKFVKERYLAYLLFEDNQDINKWFLYDIYDLKVIGNLQENPELLGETK